MHSQLLVAGIVRHSELISGVGAKVVSVWTWCFYVKLSDIIYIIRSTWTACCDVFRRGNILGQKKYVAAGIRHLPMFLVGRLVWTCL